ncbi:MAG: pitrilysin family protein, partial [bacterium]
MRRNLLFCLASSAVMAALAGCGAAPARDEVTATAGPRFVVQTAPQNPLVAVRLVFEVGAIDDPAGKEGLAALTGALIGEAGSKARTYAELLDALYPMAAGINVQVDRELTTLSGTVHRDNLDAYVDLLLDQVLTPRFDPADFSRLRDRATDALTKTLRSEDDEALGKEALELALYGGHPYGHPVVGTAAGLAAVTLDDVRAFHARHFTQARLVVGLGGGVPADLEARLRKRLAALPAAGEPRAPLPATPALAGQHLLLVDKPGRSTAISIGHPLPITRAHPDFIPLFLAASYLGEHRTFNGVLMQNMRGKRGLNYGDYAYVEAFVQDGWSTLPLPNILRRQQRFEIWVRPVPADKAGFALRQALYETSRLLRDGIPEAGFEETRDYLL